MLFYLGGINYTSKIIEGTYEVNSEDVYTSWTDANLTVHRHRGRTKWSGSFRMYFGTQEEYLEFLQALKDSETDEGGGYNVGLMCNNLHKFAYKQVYIKFEPTRYQKVLGKAYYPNVTIKIEEM